MLENSGGLPLGATLESAEAPRAPAQGRAEAGSYTPPLVDGERWPRPAPRGVSERVAAPVMSALAHVALVAGLLLASPIGPPVDTPEFIEIPVEVVALPPQGEAAATPAEPATADVVPELHLPAPPEVADPDIRPESAPAAIAEPDLPPPPEVDAPAVAAEPPPALETAEVATPPSPPDPVEPAPPMRDESEPRPVPPPSQRSAGLPRPEARPNRQPKPQAADRRQANRSQSERRQAEREARREAAEAARHATERRRDAEARRHAAERAAQQRRTAVTSPAGVARAGAERPGNAAAAAAAQSAAAGNYRGQVIAHLAHFKRYPEGARVRQAEGVPVVAFTLDGSGRVTGAGLSRSSGHADIDAEALAMVRRAVPFPAPPAGAGRSFSASIGFRLR